MNAFAMQFAWSSHREPGRYPDLLVWIRPRGQWEWTRVRVTPDLDGAYTCHAWGKPIFQLTFEVVGLLVRLLPHFPQSADVP